MTTNQTIDGVRRDTVEITRELAEQLTEVWNGVNARIELRKMLDADKVNNRQMGLMQFVEEHPIKPAAQPHGEPVAEIVSKYGDPEAFGERELITLKDISKFPYGTKLYAEQPASVAVTRPAHANPPPSAEPSGTHPHNDGLDEMRKPK